MGWSGEMICNVVNQTGGRLTTVYAAHKWNNIISKEDKYDLDEGDYFSFTFQTGAGGSDEWTVRFIDDEGGCYYRTDKQCNLEEGDYKSGIPVHINLEAGSNGFSIELPDSSSCLDNYYDRC